MQRHFLATKKFFLLMLIPLILINGRGSAGCFCSDGHFELFCGGHSCCAGKCHDLNSEHVACDECCDDTESVVSERTDHHCCDCIAAKSGNTAKSGNAASTINSTASCHRLSLIPMTLGEIEPIQMDEAAIAFDNVYHLDKFLHIETSRDFPFLAFLPPRERLKLFQRLLI